MALDPAQLEQSVAQINKTFDESFTTAQKALTIREQLLKSMEAEEEKQKAINALMQKSADLLETEKNIQLKLKQIRDEEDKDKKKLLQQELDGLQELKEAQEELHKEKVDQVKKEIDLQAKQQKAIEDAEKKLAEEQQKNIEKRKAAEKELADLKKKFLKDSLDGLKQFATAMTEGFNLPLLGTRIKGFREILTDIIKAPAEAFRKFGFLSDSYVQSIGQMREGLAGFGITEKDMYEAVGELNQGLADFSGYSTATQRSLIDTTTKLSLAGFAASKTTAAMVGLTKVFGQTATQAEGTIKRVAALSLTLGQGQKGLDDFISLSPKLVGFGSRAEEVFSKTAIAAKKLGMNTDELFGIMDQYDSFEKAANAAGELNVALGGQFVDSLDLMKASLEGGPTEVLKQLQDAFNKSGTSVDNLTRSQIKYFASAAGMKEDQFMKVFRNGGKGIEEYTREQEEAAKKQEDLNKIALKTQDIFQQLQNAFVAAFSDKATIDSFVSTVKDLANFVKDYIVPGFKWLASNTGLMKSFFVIGPLIAFGSTLFGIYQTFTKIKALTTAIQASTAAIEAAGGAGAAGGAAAGAGGVAGAGFLGVAGGTAATVLGGAALAAGIGIAGGMAINRARNLELSGGKIDVNDLTPEEARQREAIRANARARQAVTVQDAFAPGGSMITTPQGGRMITSAQDSVIAAKEGGILAQKLDVLISKIDGLAARPIMMDGKKVNSVLAESNRYNPFVA